MSLEGGRERLLHTTFPGDVQKCSPLICSNCFPAAAAAWILLFSLAALACVHFCLYKQSLWFSFVVAEDCVYLLLLLLLFLFLCVARKRHSFSIVITLHLLFVNLRLNVVITCDNVMATDGTRIYTYASDSVRGIGAAVAAVIVVIYLICSSTDNAHTCNACSTQTRGGAAFIYTCNVSALQWNAKPHQIRYNS